MAAREEEDAPRVGFLVNPVAGMGGPVALKGTDDAVEEARRRGAVPVAPQRARRFLEALTLEVSMLTCSGPMGAGACRAANRDHRVLVDVNEPTTAEDTKKAARTFQEEGVDLLVFVGGDGTAVDVAEAIGHQVPCLGVPGGVKMNSPAFGQTPEDAATVATDYLRARTGTRLVDLLEVDEEGLREGRVERTRLGSLRVPEHGAVQPGKASPGGSLEGVVAGAIEHTKPGDVLVLGPGSTVHAVKQKLLGQDATLLGVDVVEIDAAGDAALAIEDATAQELERVPATAKIVVSPIGGQGFVIGRGNQQLAPGLLGRVGWENVLVVGTPSKLQGLDALRVDTADPRLDGSVPAHMDVVTGPGFRKRMPVRSPGDGPPGES